MVEIVDLTDNVFAYEHYYNDYMVYLQEKTINLFEFLTTASGRNILDFINRKQSDLSNNWVMFWDSTIKEFYTIELIRPKKEILISYASDYFIVFTDSDLFTILDSILACLGVCA